MNLARGCGRQMADTAIIPTSSDGYVFSPIVSGRIRLNLAGSK
jgi:hypothetical protein